MAPHLAPRALGPHLSAFGTSKAASVSIVSIFFLILGTLAVAFRFLARWTRKTQFGLDDYLMLAGLFSYYGQVTVSLMLTTNGGVGYHIKTLAPANTRTFFQFLTVVQFPYGLTMTLIRCSICALLIRVFVTKRFKLAMYGVISLNITWFLFVVFAAAAICRPFAYNWDKKIKGGKCGDQDAIYVAIAAWAIISDAAMWALPIPIVWKLQLKLGQKIALTFVFALGLMYVAYISIPTTVLTLRDIIVSILRVYNILRIDFEGDVTYTISETNIWSVVEPGVALLVGCGPLLRPIFDKIWPAKFFTWTQSLLSTAKVSSTSRTSRTAEAYGRIDEDQMELVKTTIGPSNGTTAIARASPSNENGIARGSKGSQGISVQQMYSISRD